MVATALANGKRLVRIIVLKPLAKQMLYLLLQRLGGLVNRRLSYAPFHRKTPLSSSIVGQLVGIYRECMDVGGVFLTQPEYILSFQLIGIDRLYAKDVALALSLMLIQQWLRRNCRDVLDESDEILNVNWELVYTVGTQQLMDGRPDRWTVTQAVFSFVMKHASGLHEEYPHSVDMEQKSDAAFPVLRVFSADAAERLLSILVADIGHGYIPGISFDHCPKLIRQAALSFISNRTIDQELVDRIRKYFTDTAHLQNLFLLRGLIAHRILLFGLQSKRWLVNYGLDPSRCMMAVPYRAKGVPSHRAEFGHPDVAIGLTCLSYYYTGLTENQLRLCFDLLLRMADPHEEYEWWQTATDLPPWLRSLNAVNLEDAERFRDILFPAPSIG